MTERGRREYAEGMRQRYQQARRRERGALLDEYCRVTRGHRKAAIRRLGAPARRRGRRPGRPARYGSALLPLLERLWLASDQLSGKLLHAILPALVTALERHHGAVVAPAVRQALLAASPATLDRLLRPLRRRRPRQPRRLAPAVGSLRAQIPLRTWSEWRGVRPGALQGDLVLHCGESLAGRYCAHPRRRRRGHHVDRAAGALGSCTTSASRAPSSTSRPDCRLPSARGTATLAVSSSTPACSAGASVTASASPAAGPTARTIRPGSSSATASSSAASSATIATAPAPRGLSCSALRPAPPAAQLLSPGPQAPQQASRGQFGAHAGPAPRGTAPG